MKKELSILIVLFVAAFAIRVIGVDFGLPHQTHPYSAYIIDEQTVLISSLLIGKGQYSYILREAPLFYYLSFLVLAGYYLILQVGGIVSGWGDMIAIYLIDNSSLLMIGRLFAVVASSATVPATYLLGKLIAGRKVGIFSSIFLLFSFGHIVYAKYFRLDSYLPLAFVISMIFILRMQRADAGRLRPFVIAGLATGLAMATKVTAFSLLVPIGLVGLIRDGRFSLKSLRTLRFDPRWVYGLVVMTGVYISLAAPGLALLSFNLRSISGAVARPPETQEPLPGPDSTELSPATTLYGPAGELPFINASAVSPYAHSLPWHLTRILPQQLGIGVYALAAIGLLTLLIRKATRLNATFVFLLIGAYLIPIGWSYRTTWRDMLPVLPFLSIAAGSAFVLFIEKLESMRQRIPGNKGEALLLSLGLFIVIGHPLVSIYGQKRLINARDTREIALEWFESVVPAGSVVGVETYSLDILDGESRNGFISSASQSLVQFLSPSASRPTYEIFRMVEDLSLARDALDPEGLIPYIVENKIEYVVLSSGFYSRFFNAAIEFHSPQRVARARYYYDLIESNLVPITSFLPDSQSRPGPIIRVYQVPSELQEPGDLIQNAFDPYAEMNQPTSDIGYYQFSPW